MTEVDRMIHGTTNQSKAIFSVTFLNKIFVDFMCVHLQL